jgi:von Willebrand factor type A domain
MGNSTASKPIETRRALRSKSIAEKKIAKMEQDFDAKSSGYMLDESVCAVQFELRKKASSSSSKEASPSKDQESFNSIVVFALDTSGSMAGSAIAAATSGVAYLWKKLIEEHGCTHEQLVLTTFSSVSKVHNLDPRADQACAEIRRISASGGTNFRASFDTIGRCAKQSDSAHVTVVFFTDGQDTSRGWSRGGAGVRAAHLQESIDVFAAMLNGRAGSSTILTIGFTGDHDATLLGDLTKLGSNAGAFQYVESAPQIGDAMESVLGLVGGATTLSARVVASAQQQQATFKLFLDEVPAPSADELAEMADALDDYDDEVELDGDAASYASSATASASAGGIDMRASLRGAVYVPLGVLDACGWLLSVVVSEGGEERAIDVEVARVDSLECDAEVRLVADYVSRSVTDMMVDVAKSDTPRARLNAIGASLKGIDAVVQRQQARVMKERARTRKKHMPTLQECIALLGQFRSTLASAQAGTLTNQKIAALNAVAYSRQISKRGLRKKMDERLQANVALMDRLEDMVDRAVQKIDFDALERRYSAGEVAEFGVCALSNMNWVDALRDGDALSLAINVSRSEAAIADPSKVRVNDIHETVVCADAFLDAVQFRLQKAGGDAASSAAAHGGFNASADTAICVAGDGREPISGALPLYICEEHWSVAQLRMKPVMGWTATLDVLGYSFGQIVAVPFLVLAKAASLRHGRAAQFKAIYDTCVAIYRLASRGIGGAPKLSDSVAALWRRYAVDNDRSARTIDAVANNAIFLMHALCAVAAGDIARPSRATFRALAARIADEELRRVQPGALRQRQPAETDAEIDALLDFVARRDVQPLVDNFQRAETRRRASSAKPASAYESTMLAALRRAGASPSSASSSSSGKQSADASTSTESDDASEVALPAFNVDSALATSAARGAIAEQKRRFDAYVAPLVDCGDLFCVEASSSSAADNDECEAGADNEADADVAALVSSAATLDSVGAASDVVKLAVYVQNRLHATNAARRTAIEQGTYVDFLADGGDDAAARDYLAALHRQRVESVYQSGVAGVLSTLNASAANERASIFGQTLSIVEAAGTVLGTCQGQPIFAEFLAQLERQRCPLAIDKLRLLLNGEYEGVPLICDKIGNGNGTQPVVWTPGRVHFARLFSQLRSELSIDGWKQLLPMHAAVLDRRLDREQRTIKNQNQDEIEA